MAARLHVPISPGMMGTLVPLHNCNLLHGSARFLRRPVSSTAGNEPTRRVGLQYQPSSLLQATPERMDDRWDC